MQKHYRSSVSIIKKIRLDINDKIFLYTSISFNLNMSSKNIICNGGLTPKNKNLTYSAKLIDLIECQYKNIIIIID